MLLAEIRVVEVMIIMGSGALGGLERILDKRLELSLCK